MTDTQKPTPTFLLKATFQRDRIVLRHPTGATAGLACAGAIVGRLLWLFAIAYTREADGRPGPYNAQIGHKQVQIQGDPQVIFDREVEPIFCAANIATVESLAGKPGFEGFQVVQ